MTSLSNAIARAIATWLGFGYAPFAPGTAGSLAALAIAIAAHQLFGSGRETFFVLAILLLAPGIWSAGVVARLENKEDPGLVVVDEVIGQWITLCGASMFNWKTWLAALAVFRALDIWKPPPARQLENLPGGVGIVADDVMAGIYGALAIFVIDRFGIF